jgi:hypothetical protein
MQEDARCVATTRKVVSISVMEPGIKKKNYEFDVSLASRLGSTEETYYDLR